MRVIAPQSTDSGYSRLSTIHVGTPRASTADMTKSITSKQSHILSVVSARPGITTAELHRAIGSGYAYGHHKYTYATVGRMLSKTSKRSAILVRCAPADGLRGGGLKVA
jgi:hypothetical protein